MNTESREMLLSMKSEEDPNTLIAIEYNPTSGKIHHNYIRKGCFHSKPNTNGWVTLCHGKVGDVDCITWYIDWLLERMKEDSGKIPSVKTFRALLEYISDTMKIMFGHEPLKFFKYE